MVNARIHAPDRIERCEVTVKYRKKPVVIEAVLLENTYDSIYNAVEFVFNIGMETSVIGSNATVRDVQERNGLDIKTLAGDMHADFGDWIIKGVKGEFYPCKPDIFEATYDKVLLACYSMIRERHRDVSPFELNEEKYLDECLECEKTVKGQFILEWCRAYDRAEVDGRTIKKMVVAIQLPTGAIELITNTAELQSKYHYYLSCLLY